MKCIICYDVEIKDFQNVCEKCLQKKQREEIEQMENDLTEARLIEVAEKLEKYRKMFPDKEIVFDIENSAIIMK